MNYHNPVLLEECIKGLKINPKGIYIDATFGGGGHSKEILKNLTSGKLIAVDQDSDAEKNLFQNDKILFINHNFKYLSNFLNYYDIKTANGILADLGISSHQINTEERGFSYRFDSTLDMRMNKNQEISAIDILNKYSENDLFRIFKEFGEIKNTYKLVSKITDFRKKEKILKTNQFIEAISEITPKTNRNKYLSKIFQAIRIELNKEIEALKKFLLQTIDIIIPGGRLVIITYHSIEDRIVKNFMRTGNFKGTQEKDFYGNLLAPFLPINKKVITPSEQEIINNNRARSAKLRIAEKK